MDVLLANPPLLTACALFAVILIMIGWLIRGVLARREEKQAHTQVLEAKRAVPQLETGLRSRDQRIERLQRDANELTDRCGELQRVLTQKETALNDLDRDNRRMKSELTALKGGQSSEGGTLIENLMASSGESAEGQVAAEVYERVKKTLLERDEQIEALEKRLNDASDPASVGGLQAEVAGLTEAKTALTEDLDAQRRISDRLQAELLELRERNEMVADLAKRRSDRNRALKDSSAEIESRLPDLETKLGDHQATIVDRENSIRRLLSELEQAKEKHTVQSSCIAELEAEVAQEKATGNDNRVKIAALEAETTENATNLTTLNQEVIVLCQSIEGFKAELTERDAMIAQLEQQLVVMEAAEQARAEQRAASEAKESAHAEELAEEEEKQAEAQQSHDEETEMLANQVALLRTENQRMHRTMSEIIDQKSALEEENSVQRRRVDSLTSEIRELHATRMSLSSENARMLAFPRHSGGQSQEEMPSPFGQPSAEIVRHPSAGTDTAEFEAAVTDDRELLDLQDDLANREKWLMKMKVSLKEKEERIRELETRLSSE